MAIRRGLGAGLDSLITDDYITEGKIPGKYTQQETKISINDIEPNRGQPRTHFDEEALDELADSIKQYGIIEPLVVQKKGKRYEIIAGERRFRAARKAGLKEVPVVVREFADADVFVIALLENIQREDLNPIEEAQAYQRLIEELNLKQEDVANKVSKKRSTITNSMRLLKLSKEVKEMLSSGAISEGHGRALLGISDEAQQVALAKKIVEENLSVRETERLVSELKEKPKKDEKKQEKKPKNTDRAYRAAEDKLKEALGTKVEIKQKNEAEGKIEINYYSIDELERIIELIEKTGKEN
ncbi:MAG: ParB/RepB/Spo0J family partition protein [Lachnospiraceae bacterium]|nr:ParB/RepB/Spo0J family partition protein [Lachnospiraceae bacterium]